MYSLQLTDHRNLRYLSTNTPKVIRWKLAVQEFNFVLEYLDGPSNATADAFSRLCADEVRGNDPEGDVPEESGPVLATIAQAGDLPSQGFSIPKIIVKFTIPTMVILE